MNLQKILAAIPRTKTAVGASVTTVAVVNIILGLLNGWPWWSHQSTTFQTSVQTVLEVLLGYGAAWLSVVLSKGQTQTLSLTSSPLPTLQQEAPAAPEPAKV